MVWQFARAVLLSIGVGGAAGLSAVAVWAPFAFPSALNATVPEKIVQGLFGAILIVPFGMIVAVPIALVPTCLIGAALSWLKRVHLFRPSWTRATIGALAGGAVGYHMLVPKIEYWGSAVPGLIMGAAIMATWPFFDQITPVTQDGG